MKKLFAILCLCVTFASCSDSLDDEFKLNTNSVSLYVQDGHKISSNGTHVHYESANPFIATVEDTGYVKAITIGKTFINIKAKQGTAQLAVEVKPKFYTYTEPCVDFSKSISTIKTIYGTPDSESSNGDVIMYVYESNPKHFANIYLFDNDRLIASCAIIPANYGPEALNFLSERYKFIGYKDEQYQYINNTDIKKATMVVSLSKMSDYDFYQIVYIPA